MKLRIQTLRGGLRGRLRSVRDRVAFAANPLRARWQALDEGVRRMVLLGGTVLLLAILWAYAWLPASRGRAQLMERLPLMTAQLATMRAQAAELRRINSLPPVVSTRSILPLADVAGLQALFGANAKIASADGRAFEISIPVIAYTAWLDQVDNALGRYRITIGDIKLKTLASGDKSGQSTEASAKSAEVAVEFTLVEDTARAGGAR